VPKALRIVEDESFALDDIQIAAPCPAEWDDMVGSDKVRFCASCQKNVFNLSGMRRDEAIDLMRATEGRICVRFFRRADGTVLTDDCPVGVALLLRRAKRATLAAAAVSLGAVAAMLAMAGGLFGGAATKRACARIAEAQVQLEDDIAAIEEELPPNAAGPEEPVAPVELLGDPQPPPPPQMGTPPPPREVKGGPVLRPRMGKPALPRPAVEPPHELR
jgi:hypothetical protein